MSNMRMQKRTPGIMLIRDVARATGLSKTIVRKLADDGTIPSKRSPGDKAMGPGASFRYFKTADVIGFIQKYRKTGVPCRRVTRLRPDTSFLTD